MTDRPFGAPDASTGRLPRRRARQWAVPPGREAVALVALLIGGVVVPGVGWLVGLALLWTSRRWNRRDKWIGTLLPPGGLAAVFVLGFLVSASYHRLVDCDAAGVPVPGRRPGAPSPAGAAEQCLSPGPGPTGRILLGLLMAVLIVVPLLTTAYLARRARAAAAVD